jgi:hypothetical protein
MGLLMNIALGVVGAAIASAIFRFFGIVLGGWIGYLIAGFVGACLLIWIVRAVRGTAWGRAPPKPSLWRAGEAHGRTPFEFVLSEKSLAQAIRRSARRRAIRVA